MSRSTSYNQTSYNQTAPLSAKGLRLGIVTARFNLGVTEKLETGAREELLKLGADPDSIEQVRVPGAFEVPLACKALLEAGCDGVIALGAVIRGETTHYDYVCSAVERGCTETSLQLKKPIGFGILTTENEEQAYDRAGGKHGNKGAEAAQVTVEMIRLLSQIKERR
jgi:6,7-dimethyl-8-ribityllumazine synthase